MAHGGSLTTCAAAKILETGFAGSQTVRPQLLGKLCLHHRGRGRVCAHAFARHGVRGSGTVRRPQPALAPGVPNARPARWPAPRLTCCWAAPRCNTPPALSYTHAWVKARATNQRFSWQRRATLHLDVHNWCLLEQWHFSRLPHQHLLRSGAIYPLGHAHLKSSDSDDLSPGACPAFAQSSA